MKKICFVLILLGSLMTQALAQGCDGEEAGQFDFWLGEWELSWPAEQTGGEEGSLATGTNVIEKIMEGCAIQENFSFADGSYRGKSLSSYSTQLKQWQQTWVDTTGAYLLFTGETKEGQMELRSAAREQEGKTLVNRMVFRDIHEDSLLWDWQRSEDGGETWLDLWNISYKRMR